jgi:hypothetical protein
VRSAAVALAAPAALAALLAPRLAPAQGGPTVALRADAGVLWIHSDTGVATGAMRGPAVAAEARVHVSGFILGGGVLEGRLQPVGGPAAQRDLVQGTLFVGARPMPWLELSAGPVVRAYVTDSASERWVLWQARARVDAPIVAGSLATYAELWRAVASAVSLGPGAGRVQGGEAGVLFQPPQTRFWVRLAYRVDDALVGSVARSETVEAVLVSVGVGLP